MLWRVLPAYVGRVISDQISKTAGTMEPFAEAECKAECKVGMTERMRSARRVWRV
jgi:hypothetical protein